MRWYCLAFSDLNVDQLFELLKLRADVFVVEQNCVYHDLDHHDRNPQTRHLLGFEGKILVTYLRLLPPNTTYSECAIGRLVVHPNYRQQGNAHLLLKQGIEQAKKIWPNIPCLQLGAQAHLQQFYQLHGFTSISAVYLEDGIPHIDMEKRFV
jgi:ElaA protein